MTSMICPIERHLNAREARRLKAEDRYLARMEKREAIAEKMIGTVCRAVKRCTTCFLKAVGIARARGMNSFHS